MRVIGRVGQLHDRIFRPAFSLVELVMVVFIVGVVAGIAVPRFSRASESAAESALRDDLFQLRHAIDLYWAEHGETWSGRAAAGNGAPAGSAAAFEFQLTLFTNLLGKASRARGPAFSLGPYLQSIPKLPVGRNAGNNGVACHLGAIPVPSGGAPVGVGAGTGADPAGAGIGWDYQPATGEIRAHCPPGEMGSNKIPYHQW